MFFPKSNEPAVSPVIGTILLVAITVVIVAIITAVVMGMSGGLQEKKEVGLTITPFIDYNTISKNVQKGVKVIVHGGKDVPALRNLTVLIDNTGTYKWDEKNDGIKGTGDYYFVHYPEVGKVYSYRMATNPDSIGYTTSPLIDIHVVVIGEFDDGTTQVLFDSMMTIPPYNA